MPDTMAPETDAENSAAVPTALACLAIVGRLLGSDLTVADLLQASATDDGAMGTDQLIACARRVGFQCKPLRIGFGDLAEAEPFLPGIVRFNDGSCMVLLEVRREGGMPSVVLQDPNAEGDAPLVLDRLRFEQAWTGDLVLIRRGRATAGDGQPFDWRLARQIVLRERPLVRDLVLSSLGLSFLALAPILLIQLLAQRVLLYRTGTTLLILIIVFLAVIAAETIFGALRRFIIGRLAARTDARLSTDLFDRILAMPLTTVERMSRGTLALRVEHLAAVRAALTGDLLGTLLDVGILVFFLPLMFYFSPTLTGLVVTIAIVIAIGVLVMLPRYRVRTAAVAEAEERRAAFQTQAIVGAKTIKALALDVGQSLRWRRLSDEVAARRTDLSGLTVIVDGVTTVLDRFLLTGTLAIEIYVYAIAGDVAAVGTIMAFYLLVQRLIAPLPALAAMMQSFEELRRALGALGATVNRPGQEPRAPTAIAGPMRGAIAFSDVNFRYPGAVRPALKGVTFACPAGAILGIMGRSGSGKSTIARLLLRLYQDHRGTIAIDEHDIRDYDAATLRRSVGIVQQDSFIFSGTIRENITAARGEASFEEMTAAARMAGADEFIDRLPRGYETVIQEGSPNLSAGQRQRLALARTLITNPRILVLDEALSALDGEIEMRVLANLRKMAGERTVVLVSHRLSSLMVADTILVLDDGVVQDIGPHAELLERCDLYSSQWHRERTPPDSDTPSDRLLALS